MVMEENKRTAQVLLALGGRHHLATVALILAAPDNDECAALERKVKFTFNCVLAFRAALTANRASKNACGIFLARQRARERGQIEREHPWTELWLFVVSAFFT